MVKFGGVEIGRTMDEKFRLNIPVEIVRTKTLRGFVYLVNEKLEEHYLTRIYYRKPRIPAAVKVRLDKTQSDYRVTIIKSIREKSFSFFYENQVMIVDKGDYLEILPWPNI